MVVEVVGAVVVVAAAVVVVVVVVVDVVVEDTQEPVAASKVKPDRHERQLVAAVPEQVAQLGWQKYML